MIKLAKNLCLLSLVSISVVHANSIEKGSAQVSLNASAMGFTADPLLNGLAPTSQLEFVTRRTPASIFQSGCKENTTLDIIEGVRMLSSNVTSISKFYTCPEMRESGATLNGRFYPSQCLKAITCRMNVSGINTANMSQADITLNEIIAKDYAMNTLSKFGDKMEQLENLKNFAQKKFKTNLGSQCLARFDKKNFKTCNSKYIEDAFEEKQKDCTFGLGCYNLENVDKNLVSYKSFKEKNPSKAPRDYFEYRIKTTTEKALSEDDERMAKIAEAVTSDSFKKLKGDQRTLALISAIGLDNDGRLKDPVLGFDLGIKNSPEYLKSNEKIKEIVKFLDKDISKEAFIEKFDQYRKKRAEVLLGNNSICGETPSFAKICKDTTDILKGESIDLDSMSADLLSSRDLKTRSGVDALKRSLGESFDEQDFETLLNARRCIAYGISTSYGSPKSSRPSRPDDEKPSLENGLAGASTEREMYGPSADGVVSTSFDSKLPSGGFGKSEEPVAEDVAGIHGVNADQVESVLAPTVQTPAVNNYSDIFNSSTFDPFADKKTPSPETNESKPEDSSSTAQAAAGSNDKLNEYLMKKLADAESNLEKMKAEGEAAEADRAKQKKMDEEAALIKDLKSQIADLKTQSAKASSAKVAEQSAAAQSKVQQSSNSYGPSSGAMIASSSSRSEAPVAKSQSSESYDSSPSSSSGSSSSNKSFSSANGAILSSVSNADGSKTTTLASGIVVTTVDGMTTEKAAQTISNRIIELNGTPFYIEEGGMVKEVIAVIKDGKVLLDENGKPIYEKIVKGKVGDKKFAKVKDSKRAPASITDAADLKRAEEEKAKRERAEYMKLKSLTNEALKKK